MFFITQYESPLFSKFGFVCHSSRVLMCHGDGPTIPPMWFISMDRQHSVFADVIRYSQIENCCLIAEDLSKFWCTKRVWVFSWDLLCSGVCSLLKWSFFYWEHDGLPDVVSCEVCFLCVTMFLFLFVIADSSQMPREGTKESFAMLQSSQ